MTRTLILQFVFKQFVMKVFLKSHLDLALSYLLLAVISVGDPLGDTLLPVDWKGLRRGVNMLTVRLNWLDNI